MSRLVVLSNRVKLPDKGPMAGGLAVALNDVLKGRSVIWMGWNGEIEDSNKQSNEFHYHEKVVSGASVDGQRTTSNITYITTNLTPCQYQHYYCGFANNVLWLLLHEQSHLVSQAPDDYAGYQEVNRRFAQQLKDVVEPDDVIWVHDYHFLSVAYHCRKLGMNNRIGFFLHIPFAPLTFWQTLSKSAELIYHLAHYNLIGTQTEQDKANCLAVLQHYLKDSCLDSAVNSSEAKQHFTYTNRSVSVQLALDLDAIPAHCLTVNTYPIGINVDRIQNQIERLSSAKRVPAPNNSQKNLVKSTAQQIIAVDRIDYSKGLLARFSAYRAFLEQYPQYQNQLKFLQIACPSRLDLPVYQQLYEQVKLRVQAVNQQFLADNCTCSSLDQGQSKPVEVATCNATGLRNNDPLKHWQAITYSEKVLCHEKLVTAFYQSDVGWVNSLKDGMNLVAKEYIAAQNPDNPGVLLLSRYAGAAAQMQEAVLIDPQQPASIIQGLKTALTLPLAERKSRYQTLLKGLKDYDIHAWQQDFLDDLYDTKKHQNPDKSII